MLAAPAAGSFKLSIHAYIQSQIQSMRAHLACRRPKFDEPPRLREVSIFTSIYTRYIQYRVNPISG